MVKKPNYKLFFKDENGVERTTKYSAGQFGLLLSELQSVLDRGNSGHVELDASDTAAKDQIDTYIRNFAHNQREKIRDEAFGDAAKAGAGEASKILGFTGLGAVGAHVIKSYAVGQAKTLRDEAIHASSQQVGEWLTYAADGWTGVGNVADGAVHLLPVIGPITAGIRGSFLAYKIYRMTSKEKPKRLFISFERLQ